MRLLYNPQWHKGTLSQQRGKTRDVNERVVPNGTREHQNRRVCLLSVVTSVEERSVKNDFLNVLRKLFVDVRRSVTSCSIVNALLTSSPC